MPSFDQGEEIFFDSEEQLMSNLEYDVWLREPESVEKRRDNFLHKMGFLESPSIVEHETIEFEFESTENLLLERQNSNSEANCSVDYSDHNYLDEIIVEETLVCPKECEFETHSDKKTKKVSSWWRQLIHKKKKNQCGELSKDSNRIRIEHTKKKCIECTAVYSGQEIRAHNGLIWTMKFSPDGQFLATGGEDGVVCVFRVGSIDASCDSENCNFGSKIGPISKKMSRASIIIPEKILHIEEEPIHKFHGHGSDVLDLAWSTSNHLLSSSMDKTVRLWQVGSEQCLGVFHHNNYVTCVQFNPVDENYFISGSVDGKVRIWGVRKKRVEDWVNARDIVTAICYQPNGKGFVVGSVSGTCRFYETSGDEIVLNAEINIGKRSSRNKITGIQFLKDDSERVMITSEDSKIRILDNLEVVRKYKGLTKSGSQMSASFTPNGSHIISVGEDSQIYMWNYDDLSIQTSNKTLKSIRSCESFFSEGISVAIPWSETATKPPQDRQEENLRESDRFSIANWFSMDAYSRGTLTWPEEKLPLWDMFSDESDSQPCDDHLHQRKIDGCGSRIVSSTWGLVFVTANWDGTIRTYHNYGLPMKT